MPRVGGGTPRASPPATLRPRCSTRRSGCCACSTEPRDRAVLAPLVKREILWRVITGEQGAAVRSTRPRRTAASSHISRAVGWIREHAPSPSGSRTWRGCPV
ncbi:AraC family transcriptional regulator N-terminal domain-containing protein [Streptomyces sp. L7]